MHKGIEMNLRIKQRKKVVNLKYDFGLEAVAVVLGRRKRKNRQMCTDAENQHSKEQGERKKI